MKKNLYFLHIPKTAGTYTTRALEPLLGSRFIREGHCGVPSLLYPWHTRDWVVPIFNSVKREDCIVFSIVRNPFDMLVSMYCFGFPYWAPRWANKSKTINWPFTCFRDYVYGLCKWPDYPWIYPPQKNSLFFQLFDEDGSLIPDFIIRQENLQEGLQQMLDALGIQGDIPQQPVNVTANKKHTDYTSFYDKELFELVSKNYAGDLEYFGYSFAEHDGKAMFTPEDIIYNHNTGEYGGTPAQFTPPAPPRLQGENAARDFHPLGPEVLQRYKFVDLAKELKNRVVQRLTSWCNTKPTSHNR